MDDDDAVASVDAAICAPETREVYLEAATGTPIYADARVAVSAAQLVPGTIVLRRGVREIGADEVPYAEVVVKTGPHAGTKGFVVLEALRVRTPAGSADGTCANGVDPRARASAAERATTGRRAIGVTVLRSTMMCLVGAGEGVFDGASTLIDGVHALMGLGKEGWRRVKLAALYLRGSEEAGRELRAAFHDDAAKARALVSAVAQLVPRVGEYLSDGFVWFRALEPELKAKYLCQLVGRIGFEVVTAWLTGMAVGKLAGAMRATVDKLDVEVSKVAKINGRIGDSPVVVLDDAALARAELTDFGERFLSRHAELVAATDVATKVRLVRAINDDLNVLSNAEKKGVKLSPLTNGAGNCGNAAITAMVALATGRPTCVLPYLTDEMASADSIMEHVEKFGAARLLDPDPLDAAALERALGPALREGQMALLLSDASPAGHATVAVKLDGKLWNLNNQGWENGMGFADHELQTLGGWAKTWEAIAAEEKWTDVGFAAVVTDLEIPFAKPASAAR